MFHHSSLSIRHLEFHSICPKRVCFLWSIVRITSYEHNLAFTFTRHLFPRGSVFPAVFPTGSAAGGPSIPVRHPSARHGILPVLRACNNLFPALRGCIYPRCARAFPRLEDLRLPGEFTSIAQCHSLRDGRSLLLYNDSTRSTLTFRSSAFVMGCVIQVYTRYRFLQRETRWKGLEDSLDECIDESMRTLDQVRE